MDKTMETTLIIFILFICVLMIYFREPRRHHTTKEFRDVISLLKDPRTRLSFFPGSTSRCAVGETYYIDLDTAKVRRLKDDSPVMSYSDDPLNGLGADFDRVQPHVKNALKKQMKK